MKKLNKQTKPTRRGKSNKKINRRKGTKTTVSVPAAYGIVAKAPLSGPITVRHSEYVFPVDIKTTETSATFYTLTLPTFKWLNGIKEKYTEFQINQLSFTYVTTIGSGTQGNVAMALNYLVGSNKRELSYPGVSLIDGAVTGPVWGNFTMQFDNSAQLLKRKFVIPVEGDGNSWNALGKLIIATTVGTANTNVGWIRADYDITFMKPLASPLPVEVYEIKVPESTGVDPLKNSEVLNASDGIEKLDTSGIKSVLVEDASSKDVVAVKILRPGKYNFRTNVCRHNTIATADYMTNNISIWHGDQFTGVWTNLSEMYSTSGAFVNESFGMADQTGGKLETTGDTLGLLDATLDLFKCPCSVAVCLNRAAKWGTVAAKLFFKATSLSPLSLIPSGIDYGVPIPDSSMALNLVSEVELFNEALAAKALLAKELLEQQEKLIL